MKRMILTAIFASFVFTSSAATAGSFSIEPFDAAPIKGIHSQEMLTVSGTIDIVPMMGMTVILITPNLGYIIVGKQYSFPKEIGDKFASMKSSGASLEMKGMVLTYCTDAGIKKAGSICRMFDPSHPISVKIY